MLVDGCALRAAELYHGSGTTREGYSNWGVTAIEL